nr:unnamed protein product [Callosobruchus analis]
MSKEIVKEIILEKEFIDVLVDKLAAKARFRCMDAYLRETEYEQVTKTEYRAVTKFLTKEGLTPKIIKERLDGVYGRSSPSYSVLKDWAKRFRIGQEFLEDDERPGRPVEVITEDPLWKSWY